MGSSGESTQASGKPTRHGAHARVNVSAELLAAAHAAGPDLLASLGSRLAGLSAAEVAERHLRFGPNQIAREQHRTWGGRLWDNLKNPLVILLSVLGLVSYATGDARATVVIFAMVVLGVVLRFFQEARADNAAAKLRAMVSTTVTAVRDGKDAEIPLQELVPGDVIRLAAGDLVPADMRVLSAKDLFLNQAALTGESLPVEKTARAATPVQSANPLELPGIAFLGSSVESGAGVAVVVHTGERTYFGSLAASIVGERELTSFDRGINRFTWLMIRFIAVMVPVVFLLNGFRTHDWLGAFLFATAVAVGLTPEMLPMIVSVNLSKGALAMARKKVIVRRLNAIQNFGAIDVLCTDKTGTLTQGRIVLERHIDVHGNPSERVMHYGYLNSYHHTGLKNLLDEAVLAHSELEERLQADSKYRKIDEIPFDFVRRRMSVVVEDTTGLNTLICKGAVAEVMALCTHVDVDGQVLPVEPAHDAKRQALVEALNAQGFRVVAVAYKEIPNAPDEPVYAVRDECGLILLGFLAFLDPPKDSAREALQRLHDLRVDVKILTGDNETITSYICGEVGMPVGRVLLGSEIEALDEAALAATAAATTVFARLVPSHKERIVRALQSRGSVVGFMGDGINDAPALKAADVGISVDAAVDIAKESSDIILLESSLLILEQGVMEGRRVFGNIVKYIKMAASSNFGNMFSVVGASAFLPFVPMLPIQVLTNNLLYDFSQTTIPTDQVDPDWLKKPRQWAIGDLQRFIFFIGPISSLFDYATFWIMLRVFDCWHDPALFHTGWFVESLFTQTLIIHVIRTNKIPFLQSRASWPLTLTSILIVLAGAGLTISPLAATLGFVPLPPLYWALLGVMLVCYLALTQVVKVWYLKRYGE